MVSNAIELSELLTVAGKLSSSVASASASFASTTNSSASRLMCVAHLRGQSRVCVVRSSVLDQYSLSDEARTTLARSVDEFHAKFGDYVVVGFADGVDVAVRTVVTCASSDDKDLISAELKSSWMSGSAHVNTTKNSACFCFRRTSDFIRLIERSPLLASDQAHNRALERYVALFQGHL